MSITNNNTVNNNQFLGPEVARGNILDSILKINSILDGQSGSTDSKQVFRTVEGNVLAVSEFINHNGQKEAMALQTNESRMQEIAQTLKSNLSSVTSSLEKSLSDYKTKFLGSINDILNDEEQEKIDKIEENIDINASDEEFELGLLTLENKLGQLQGSINEFDDNLQLESMLFQTLGIIGNQHKAFGANTRNTIDPSVEVDGGIAKLNVATINDNRSVFDILYGRDGVDIDGKKSSSSLGSAGFAGVDDKGNVVHKILSEDLQNKGSHLLIATEGLIANRTNSRYETRERKIDTQGNPVDSDSPIPGYMSSSTTSAMIINKLVQDVVNATQTQFGNTADNNFSNALGWTEKTISFKGSDGQDMSVKAFVPSGTLSKKLFSPVPADKNISSADLAEFNKHIANIDTDTILNKSVKDFNNDSKETLAAIKSAMQEQFDQFFQSDDITSSKQEFLSNKESYSTQSPLIRENIGIMSDSIASNKGKIFDLQKGISQTQVDHDLATDSLAALQTQLATAGNSPLAADIILQIEIVKSQISEFEAQMEQGKFEINLLTKENLDLKTEQQKLEANLDSLKEAYKNSLIAYSDLLTDKVENNLEKDVSKIAESKLDPSLKKVKSGLLSESEELAKFVEEDLMTKVDKLFQADVNTNNNAVMNNAEIKRLLLMILFLSFIEESEWDYNLSEATRTS